MGNLSLIFWDVQHGSACYIHTPNGQHLVVDLGTGDYSDSNSTFSPLLHLKNKCGIARLDGVLITHPHTDHIDDIGNFAALNPRVLWRPKHLSEDDIRGGNQTSDKDKLDEYLAINTRYNQPIAPAEDPFSPPVNGCFDCKPAPRPILPGVKRFRHVCVHEHAHDCEIK